MTNGTAEYRVYDLDAFKRHDFTPVTRFPALHRIQSWCLYGDFVHQNAGDPLEESWWTVYAIASGAVIERTLDTTALHLEHRETEAITARRTPAERPPNARRATASTSTSGWAASTGPVDQRPGLPHPPAAPPPQPHAEPGGRDDRQG
ncbi:hypothetical protein [Streptomyces sp. NPDC000961]|uniref:hypothetical protein n=1 Tax=Streptomyces sp. NPDC000961 TaxID=3364541 RepID=UPI00369C506D